MVDSVEQSFGHGGVRAGSGRKPKAQTGEAGSAPPSRAIKRRLRPKKSLAFLPETRPNSAGIDIGAKFIVASVPEDRSAPSVRSFETFTQDLNTLAEWLAECGIENVAMESTGVYWIPVYQILEARGFKVTLVNARHVKNVSDHKTDVRDSRWLRFLHSVGLLRGSFRPSDQICALRSLMRHHDKLVSTSSSHVLRMQKALTQMNIQLHNVISDICGASGMAILDAILDGERDATVLADLCLPGIQADKETVRKSLEGDWRPEHLFALKQELCAYRFHRELIQECETEMDACLEECLKDVAKVEPTTKKEKMRRGRQVFSPTTIREQSLTRQMHRAFGTDLTPVPGLGIPTIFKLFTEVGSDLSAFPTSGHFTSWLGLSPDPRISGGSVLSAKTRHVPSRAATTFRLAANSLQRSQTPLGDHLRRMKAKLGKQEGITATANKLARIFYHLVTTGEQYDETRLGTTEKQKQRRAAYLIREAAKLGLTITPNSVPQ